MSDSVVSLAVKCVRIVWVAYALGAFFCADARAVKASCSSSESQTVTLFCFFFIG